MDENQITIVFEKGHAKPTLPVTGAFGGPTPDRTAIVAHLFVEHFSVPNYVTHEVAEDGSVDLTKGEPVARGTVTREVLSTIVLTPQAAQSLGQWLLANVQKLGR